MRNAGQTVSDAAHPGVRARLLRVALAAVGALLLLPALSAQAAVTHPFVDSFGSFTSPESVAIDQATGEVYVLDSSTGTVSRFNADGTPSDFSAGPAYVSGNQLTGTSEGGFTFVGGSENQIAVAPAGAPGGTAGDIYVLDPPGAVEIFDSTGAYLGRIDDAGGAGFGYACGLAVAPDGALYVGDFEAGGSVSKYVPSADPATDGDFDSKITGLGGICNIAAGSDTVYASNWPAGPLTAYPTSLFPGGGGSEDASSGGTVVELNGDPITSLTATVDPATDDLYVSEGGRVAQLDKAGTLLGFSGAGVLIESYGLAVRGSTQELFVSDRSQGTVHAFGGPVVVPDVVTKGVTGNDGGEATIHGAVNPNGVPATYRFEYGTTTDYGAKAPASSAAPGSAGSGVAEVEVNAELTGLEPDTLYHYRLVARNDNGTTRGEDATFTTLAVPGVRSVHAKAVGQTSALLNAEIDPQGLETTYRFEYGPTTAYGSTAPVPDGAAGAGDGPTMFSQSIAGLEPGTTYHYRVTATNALGSLVSEDRVLRTVEGTGGGTDTCPNRSLRAEQHATHLPDCRAYELVSPADKEGSDVIVHPRRARVSASESPAMPRAITFASHGGFADAQGSGVAFDYLAQRTATPGTQGWSSHGITPLQEPMSYEDIASAQEPLYWATSADLSRGLFGSFSPLGPAPNTDQVRNYYLRSDLRTPGAGSYQLLSDAFAPLTPVDPAVKHPGEAKQFLGGASTDLSHVLFQSIYPLTADAPASTELDKTYLSVNGEVSFVGQVPSSGDSCTGTECVPVAGASVLAGAGARLGTRPLIASRHSLSADGSRAIFTVSTGTGAVDGTEGDLYQRDSQGTASSADDTTVRINASERTSPAAPEPARYLDAATNGSRVFFLSTEALTDDASPISVPKLYMWSREASVDGDHLTYLSADAEQGDPQLGSVQVALGISAAGDAVYFVQRGQIVDDAPLLNQALGIYLWREGEGVSYLGKIDQKSLGTSTVQDSLANQYGSRVSRDGSQLLISLYQAPWPGAGEHGDCTGFSETPCTQLYLYDVGRGERPLCLSCDPHGAPPVSHAFFEERSGTAGAQPTQHLNSPMSEDGKRVFFTSGESLRPGDTNGVFDVYMWQAVGKGDCQAEGANGGCLSLISTGTSAEDSYFMEATPNGSDAFFVTAERLSGWDFDGNRDLYDARVEGGFPEPSPRPAQCAGDSCLAPVPGAPAGPATPSAGLAGAGDPPVRRAKPRCRKGQRKVRRGGKVRCVPKKGKLKKRTSKQAKTKGRGGR